jgi:acetyl-CoA C-acetyltransferase
MLQTAEEVAQHYRVSRERQDLFGAESQRRAAAGKLAGESAPFRA